MADFALQFDGIQNYASFASPTRTAGQPFSVIVWIKTTNKPTSFAWAIIGARNGSTPGSLWKIGLEASGYTAFDYDTLGSGGKVVGASRVDNGQSHMIAGVYDGNTLTLYVDGAQNGTPISSKPNATVTVSNGCFAKRSDGTEYFEGIIDEGYIFTRALSSTEILNYFNTKTIDLTNIWGKWLMDEGTGTTIADSSGNGNTGTLMKGAGGYPVWVTGLNAYGNVTGNFTFSGNLNYNSQ